MSSSRESSERERQDAAADDEQATERGEPAPTSGRAVADFFSTDEIFHRIVATAREEFSRSNRLLFLSGLAAGLSLGLSFVGVAVVEGKLAALETRALVANLFYPLGFLLVVGGRYQLFTENTITPVTLVLTRIASVPVLLRIWLVVFLANLIGAAGVALVLAYTGLLSAESVAMARDIAVKSLEPSWSALFWKGIFAGWLIASIVWLSHSAKQSTTRFFIVFVITYAIPTLEFAHCIVGASELVYGLLMGDLGVAYGLEKYSAVVLGNTLGGVLLVAILNYAQTRAGEAFVDGDEPLLLTWREWLLGRHLSPGPTRPPPAREDQDNGA